MAQGGVKSQNLVLYENSTISSAGVYVPLRTPFRNSLAIGIRFDFMSHKIETMYEYISTQKK